MSERCEDGRRYRYDDGRHPNDPDNCGVDAGVCPRCQGRGCENRVNEENLLTDIAQILDSRKAEGCVWSEWEQEVREKIDKRLLWITTKPQHVDDEIVF